MKCPDRENRASRRARTAKIIPIGNCDAGQAEMEPIPGRGGSILAEEETADRNRIAGTEADVVAPNGAFSVDCGEFKLPQLFGLQLT